MNLRLASRLEPVSKRLYLNYIVSRTNFASLSVRYNGTNSLLGQIVEALDLKFINNTNLNNMNKTTLNTLLFSYNRLYKMQMTNYYVMKSAGDKVKNKYNEFLDYINNS